MKAIVPNILNCTSNSVPETEFPAWSDSGTYSAGDSVIRPDHHIYEALLNVGAVPNVGTPKNTNFAVCVGAANEVLVVYSCENDTYRLKMRCAAVSDGGVTLGVEIPLGELTKSYGYRPKAAYNSYNKIYTVVYSDNIALKTYAIGITISDGVPTISAPAIELLATTAIIKSLIFVVRLGVFLVAYETNTPTWGVIAFSASDSVITKGTAISASGSGMIYNDDNAVHGLWYIYNAVDLRTVYVSEMTVVGVVLTLGTPREVFNGFVYGLLTPLSPATVSTGTNPYAIAISPSGGHAYVCNNGSNTVSQYSVNSSTGLLTPLSPATVSTGTNPCAITISPSGSHAYVVNLSSNTVSQYSRNSSTGLLTPLSPATVSTGTNPYAITISPSGSYAYVCNYDSNTVSQYSRNSSTGLLTPLSPATVSTGTNPCAITISPSGSHAYVVNLSSNTVSQYATYTARTCELLNVVYDALSYKTLAFYGEYIKCIALSIGIGGIITGFPTDTPVVAVQYQTFWDVVYDSVNHKTVCFYADGNDQLYYDSLKAFSCTITDYTVSFGAIKTLTTNDIDARASACFEASTGQFVFGYQVDFLSDGTTVDDKGYVATCKLSGTSIINTGTQTPPEDLLETVNGLTSWLDTGTTNAWSQFNNIINSQTIAASPITTIHAPGVFDSLAMMNIDADAVTVTVKTAGGTTREVITSTVTDTYSYIMPALSITVNATDTVTITATKTTGNVKIGEVKIGVSEDLGITQTEFRKKFESYSDVTTDIFGNTTIVSRPKYYRISGTSLLENTRVKEVEKFFEEYADTEVVYVPTDLEGYENTATYGYPEQVEFEYITPKHSILSFTIRQVI